MNKTIYRLFFVIVFSMLIVSCSSGGDDAVTVNNEPVNTDCVLGVSAVGNCTL